MIRIAIVDDEKEILQYLSRKLEEILVQHHYHAEVEAYLSGKLLLERHAENRFHIILMDLDMPEISGMEAAARIRKEDEDTILIFVTNREDLVFRSFQYEVAAFIRKSHLESEFSAVMIEAYQKAKSKSSRYLLKTENGEAVFSANDILYFVSSDHKVWIHNKDGTKIRVLYTLEKLGSILSRDIFIRCHSGFIVNCNYIFSIDMEQIKLTTNESIPLSRYRRKEVKSMFHTYLRSL